jgi:hypothetical protein
LDRRQAGRQALARPTPRAPGQWRRAFLLRRARLRWAPSMPPISRKKPMNWLGAIPSCRAISNAAAHFAAALASSLGKAERIRTSWRAELGAMASSVSRRSSRSA